jgi:flagellar biosynthesis protein FliR
MSILFITRLADTFPTIPVGEIQDTFATHYFLTKSYQSAFTETLKDLAS